MAMLFMIVMGSFSLAGVFGYLKAIIEARIAGHLAYQVIDHKPDVIADQEGAKKLTKEELRGHIEFKNVKFKYPTRDDLVVLKNFSCVFEAGKTTALVGPSGCGKSTII